MSVLHLVRGYREVRKNSLEKKKFQMNKCINPAGCSLEDVAGIILSHQNLGVQLRGELFR